MKTDLFIEKIEQKQCWVCAHFKKPVKGRKQKFEVTCEEVLRLRAMLYHKDIRLNFIDRKTGICSNFKRDFTGGK